LYGDGRGAIVADKPRRHPKNDQQHHGEDKTHEKLLAAFGDTILSQAPDQKGRGARSAELKTRLLPDPVSLVTILS
jgi:hypothetical protein